MKFLSILIVTLLSFVLDSEYAYAQKFFRGKPRKATRIFDSGLPNSSVKKGGKIIDVGELPMPSRSAKKALDDVPTLRGNSNPKLPSSTKAKSSDYTDEIRGASINTSIPAKLDDFVKIKSRLVSNGNKPLNNYKSAPFLNREGKLPKQDKDGCSITYTEHDVYTYPPPKNQDRGINRIVYGSDGSYYYTTDHYKTFTKF